MNSSQEGARKAAAQEAAALEEVYPPAPGLPVRLSRPEIELPPEEPEQPPQPGVRQAAVRSAIWLGVGFGASTILKLVSASILTQWLVPTVYALMDVANVFLQGLHMFSDVGIGTAVVQSKRGDERAFLDTAWTMHVVRGFVLLLATVVIAWPVYAVYGEPVLLILVPALGLTAALEGFKSTSLFTLDRQLLQGRAVMIDLSYAALGVVITVAWAGLIQANVWALFAGCVAQTLFVVAVSHVLLPGPRDRFRWDRSAVRELVSFGKWIFLSTAVTYLAFQADRLLLPKITNFEIAGVYGRAGALSGMAIGLMSTFVCKLIFPVYSRLHQSGRDIRVEFSRVHFTAAGFAALLVIGMLASGPAACRSLYGVAYHEAGWMLQLVAVGAWFQMLEGTTGASLLALGKASSITVGNFSRLVGVVILVPLGYWLGDQWLGGQTELLGTKTEMGSFIGILMGFNAADFLRYLVTIYIARRNGMRGVRYDVALTLLIVLLSPLAAYGGATLAGLLTSPSLPPKAQAWIEFFCQGILAVLLWGMAALAWWSFRRAKARRALPEVV
jgi:O-antigen/teichoic acid export membrane protein